MEGPTITHTEVGDLIDGPYTEIPLGHLLSEQRAISNRINRAEEDEADHVVSALMCELGIINYRGPADGGGLEGAPNA